MQLDDFILRALQEDVGPGDYTSLACVPADAQSSAKLLVKDIGIICGVSLAERIIQLVDANLKTTIYMKDGASVKHGDVVFTVQGSSQSILKAERLLLNCMQHMSGIATQTAKMVRLLEGTKTKVLDTRKTTPNMRSLEKMAVKIGGGENHRFGLYDMIMIKDNHIDYSGGIKQAINKANLFLADKKLELRIEVEARNIEEVKEILEVGNIHRIMLDNFSIDEIKAALLLINGKYETEASGGITIETIRNYAECGVDYISVGALTHSIKNFDLSLKAVL